MKYTLGDTLLKLQDVSLSFGTTKVLRDINLVFQIAIRVYGIHLWIIFSNK